MELGETGTDWGRSLGLGTSEEELEVGEETDQMRNQGVGGV